VEQYVFLFSFDTFRIALRNFALLHLFLLPHLCFRDDAFTTGAVRKLLGHSLTLFLNGLIALLQIREIVVLVTGGVLRNGFKCVTLVQILHVLPVKVSHELPNNACTLIIAQLFLPFLATLLLGAHALL